MSVIEIMPLRASPAVVDMLCEMLIEAVAAGGSVSFMHPLATEPARTFWSESLAAAAQGKRVVLGAWEGETLIGRHLTQINYDAISGSIVVFNFRNRTYFHALAEKYASICCACVFHQPFFFAGKAGFQEFNFIG